MIKSISAQTNLPALIPELPKKLFYIDNLKVALTILVILHHTLITYGAPGGWYYLQKTTNIGTLNLMTMFISINQAFFMGFFFFLSAYFIGPSYDKKGAARFVTDRLLRLGVPLVFYSLIFSPILHYLVYYFGYGHHITFIQYLSGFNDWIDFGVLWFVAALLMFTLIYALCRAVAKNYRSGTFRAPTAGAIILFAVGIGVISFFVRMRFPVGWTLHPFGFQFGRFSQYVSLFILGLLAAKNNWLKAITYQTGKRFAWFAVVLLLFFPVFYIIKVKSDMPIAWFFGRFHWQSLLYAVWEQLIGFSIIIALLGIGQKLGNKTSVLRGKLSRYTFAVYIFHPLVLISLALAVSSWAVDPAIKLLLVAPLAVAGSFILASLIVLIPGVKRVI